MNEPLRTNWAGNITFGAPDFHRPATVPGLQAAVAKARRIRVLATGHSFNDLADSPGAQVSLAGLPPEVSVDSAAHTAKVAAGLSYAELAPRLDARGFALRNLASLPHISVAGATATGTHGSGVANQNLAAAVAGLTLVSPDGDLVELRRGGDGFDGAVVHLGALGVAVSLILDLVPSFDVSQRVYENLPMAALDDHFAGLMASGYSVSLFTDWRAPRLTQVWVKQRARQHRPRPSRRPRGSLLLPPARRGTRCPARRRTRAPGSSACPAGGTTGSRISGLSFRPSAGDELQSEYLLPVAHAVPALHALDQIRDRLAPVLWICEIRAVAADELWLSPCYRQDSVAFHFTWIAEGCLGAARGRAARTPAGPVRPAPALGQALHRDPGGPPRPLRAPPGLPRPHAPLRPLRQVPQRLHRPLPRPSADLGL